MNKLNVGDYVRTKYGIAKITDLKENPYGKKTIYILDNKIINIYECEGSEIACINPLIEDMENKFDTYFGDEKCIINSSPDIIDLIEVGDYVNGFYVINKPFNQKIHTEFDDFFEEDIESVVTKESFENISYKVGE